MSGGTTENGRYVLTGGPGAGKTTLLKALARRGHRTVPETARSVIASRLAAGKPPRPDPESFARQIIEQDVANYHRTTGAAFFDRSLIDGLGMLMAAGALDRDALDDYLTRYPYHHRVFVLPPWREIYTQDDERDQTYDESVAVHASILRWYEQCGYTTVEVPRRSVAERVRFVESVIATGAHGA